MVLDPSTPNTLILDADARIIAAQTARGSYQRALLSGERRWSGADLRGAARGYLGRYAGSRAQLLRRLRAAGLGVARIAGPHGREIVALWSTGGEIVERRRSRTRLELRLA